MEISRGKIEGAQKIAVYGPEGIGKSTFASMFPNPVFIDTEGSTKKLDVARTKPNPSSWTMLLEQVRYFKANPQACNTLIIDTADWAEQLCMVEICAKSQKSGIEDFGYGKGYIYLAEEFGKLLNLLSELVEKGINVVITAHAQMRKFEQPDEMGAYDRWELKLQKKTAPLLKEWADMVLFANYKTHVVNVDNQGVQKGKNKAQGGKRVMHTAHHPCWDAKNRHGLAEELPFEYAQIAHCIPARPGSSEQKPEPEPDPLVESPFLDDDPALKQEPANEPPKEQPEPPKEEPQQDLSGVPKALADLMRTNNVTVTEIQQAVAARGYYPINTPIANYDMDFINGVLIGAWAAVFKMIQDFRDDIPF